MKTDAALSWKGLTLSAVLHGSVFAASGWVFLESAQVGTQEAPVTAEFQILSDSPSSSVASLPEPSGPSVPSPDENLPEEDEGDFPKEVMADHRSAAGLAVPNAPVFAAASSVRSAPCVPSIPKRGAKNLLPDYLENPPPRYPESSRLAGEQGVAMVRAEIASSGQVCSVSLACSSGHQALDRAAVEAVGRWKFRPASTAGIAMASEVTVPVRFELRRATDAAIRNP